MKKQNRSVFDVAAAKADKRATDRTNQQTVVCPTCDAKSGKPCVGIGEKERRSNHKARILRYYTEAHPGD